MLRHNLLITYRSFLRNKSSFLINLIGLSTGLAGVLLIFLWVQDELHMDAFHKHDNQLFQVLRNEHRDQGIETGDGMPAYLAKTFKEEFPEVISGTSISRLFQNGTLSMGDESIEAEEIFVGKEFFQVFSFELIQGDKEHVLKDKQSIIISESLAKKLFNTTENVLGKTLSYEHGVLSGSFQISGIVADVPAQSTLQFDLVFHQEIFLDNTISWETREWYTAAGQSYLLLQKGTDIPHFNSKIKDYLKPKSRWTKNTSLFVQQYSKRYLHNLYEEGRPAGGRIIYVRLFSIIAVLILLIACINFMNLSTARASRKMKEIGVKKTIGASRSSLIQQFLGESVLMVFLSLIVAGILVNVLLPQFEAFIGKPLRLDLGMGTLLGVGAIMLFTGFLAGGYPAFYLSGFKTVSILKGKRNISLDEKWIRKGLVVFQFALSVIFIVGVLVVDQQIQYTQTKNLGYNRDNILTFQRPNFDNNPEAFLSELKRFPGVANASNMNGSFISGADVQSGYNWREDEDDEKFLFQAPQIGYDMIETLGMEMLQGRSFSREFQDNQFKIIINETALQQMELEEPVGHILDKDVGNGREERQIIGVVKDFHYGSIHQKVEPLILRFRPAGINIMVKIKAGNEKTSLEQIEKLYKKFHPDDPFTYSFLDSDYQMLYQAERKVATLSKYFGGLAIIISCLGLFGLSIFTTEQRTKEIGIRKVLGSSEMGIVQMLTKDFTKTILLGILISVPVSYLVASSWLENFAYNIELDLWFFLLPGILVLALAWVTVGLQTFHAARLSPVHCLRDE